MPVRINRMKQKLLAKHLSSVSYFGPPNPPSSRSYRLPRRTWSSQSPNGAGGSGQDYERGRAQRRSRQPIGAWCRRGPRGSQARRSSCQYRDAGNCFVSSIEELVTTCDDMTP